MKIKGICCGRWGRGKVAGVVGWCKILVFGVVLFAHPLSCSLPLLFKHIMGIVGLCGTGRGLNGAVLVSDILRSAQVNETRCCFRFLSGVAAGR